MTTNDKTTDKKKCDELNPFLSPMDSVMAVISAEWDEGMPPERVKETKLSFFPVNNMMINFTIWEITIDDNDAINGK